jgi:hypothetical protein
MTSPISIFIKETASVPKEGWEIGPKEIIYYPKRDYLVFLTFEVEPGKVLKKIIVCKNSARLGKTSTIKPNDIFSVAIGRDPVTPLSVLKATNQFVLFYAPLIPIFEVKETSTKPEFIVHPRGKYWDYHPMKKSTMVLPI